MMKKVFRFGFILAVAGSWLTACSLEQTPSMPGSEPDGIVIRASMSDAQTKTALGGYDEVNGQEVEIFWQTGDKISVNGTLSEAVSLADNGKKSVNFTVNGSLSAPYKVLYPGTSSANVISLPATQSYVAHNFDSAAAACWGNASYNGSNYSVRLTPFCGVIRFALKGSANLNKIVLKSLGSEKLHGNFTLATETDENGKFNEDNFSFTGGSDEALTYNCSGVELNNADQYFYVLIPAQTYASGIEALVYQTDGAFMRLKFWGSGYPLNRGRIVAMESKTYAAGRTENLLAINALTAEDGGEPTAEAPGITVAAYNVMRLDTENRPAAATAGDNDGKIARPANAIVPDCAEMQAALGQAIYNTAADLIGFNEIGDDMYSSGLAHSLQDIATDEGAAYTWKLDFPGSSSSNDSYHYCNGFAYKASVLTLNGSGRAWLRKGSESYSTSSDSNSGDPNRYVVWAKFTHKVSGKVFYFFVTQLPTYGQDGGSGTSNTNMSGGVNAFASAKAGSYPQILVGDMNSSPTHDNAAGYTKLKNYWTDAYETLYAAHEAAGDINDWFYKKYPGTQSGTGDTYLYSIMRFTGNGKGSNPQRRIDHIMTHGACTVQSYRTVRNTYSFGSGEDEVQCAPSDHLPVVSYITLD